MYYVCYVVGVRKNALFPANWLKGHRQLLEKFVNNSLNKNQLLLAYYSQEQLDQIENGRSPVDFRPDFQLNINVEFPATGCYHVLPKRFFANFAEAKLFSENHRNVPPPVYDQRRQNESPFPNITQENDSENYSDETMDLMALNISASQTSGNATAATASGSGSGASALVQSKSQASISSLNYSSSSEAELENDLDIDQQPKTGEIQWSFSNTIHST